MFNYIIWDISPDIFNVGPISIRWYGLFFVCAFIFGQLLFRKIFLWEGKLEKNLEVLTVCILIATIVGARLGHCFIYEPNYFLLHPMDIFKIWKGGLSSYGAALGIVIAVYFYSQRYPDYSYLWLLDRLVIVIALGGFFIRLGNLMNSEVIGKPTHVPWAFIFVNTDHLPRHPTQLYEAMSCFFIFIFLFFLYYFQKSKVLVGSISGIFIVLIFSLKFLFEFFKLNQVPVDNHLVLNLGQLFSIPLIGIGCILLLHAYKVIRFKFICLLE